MRVAVVNWTSRRVGGIEEYVCSVIPALQRAGIDVAFWHELDAPADRAPVGQPDDVADFCAADMGAGKAIAALRAWNPDVLYVHGLRDLTAEAKLLQIAPAVFFLHTYVGTCISGSKTWTRPTAVPCARRFGWPCLVHFFPHGCGGNSPVTMWSLYQEQSARLRMLGRYQAILTHTDHMRREMTKHGLASQVLPFPVGAQARGVQRLEDGAWQLLFVGRMQFLKGGQVLIDAISQVIAAARRPMRVMLAGDGPDRAKWEARARAVERTTSNLTFEFTGWLSQDDVGALMNNSDLLVVPSVWPEPFGTVGPVAAQHGLPAAAFDVGGISEWLVEGVTGHLAPATPPAAAGLARAIVRCLEDPVHYASLRHGAQEMAARFTMERHLPQLIAALQRVAAPAAGAV
jgi:glycosyltransferase involved in cell wall biosynthesis